MIKQRIQHFLQHQDGNVLMLTGLAILFMFASAGAGIDFGRQQLVRLKIQQSTDAAALAASSLPSTASRDQLDAIARRYFAMNYPDNYLGIPRPANLNVAIGDNIVVSAEAPVQAQFISNVGVDTLVAAGSTSVQTQTTSTGTSYDTILVMDNSGSMRQTLANGTYRYVGSYRDQALANGKAQCSDQYQSYADFYCPTSYGYYGYGSAAECIQRYSGDLCTKNYYTDQWLSTGSNPSRLNVLRSAAWNFTKNMDDLNKNKKPGDKLNRVGFVSYGQKAFQSAPLSSNQLSDSPFINSMASWGETNSFSGMKKAKELSATFDAQHVQSVILLTDGVNNQAGDKVIYSGDPSNPNMDDGYGCPGQTLAARKACQSTVNTQTNSICREFKDKGIRVFTIALAVTDPEVKQFMTDCASVDDDKKPYFFDASQASELNAAFDEIFSTIRKVQVVQ